MGNGGVARVAPSFVKGEIMALRSYTVDTNASATWITVGAAGSSGTVTSNHLGSYEMQQAINLAAQDGYYDDVGQIQSGRISPGDYMNLYRQRYGMAPLHLNNVIPTPRLNKKLLLINN